MTVQDKFRDVFLAGFEEGFKEAILEEWKSGNMSMEKVASILFDTKSIVSRYIDKAESEERIEAAERELNAELAALEKMTPEEREENIQRLRSNLEKKDNEKEERQKKIDALEAEFWAAARKMGIGRDGEASEIPNAETIEAIMEVQRMKADPSLGKTYADFEVLLEDMDND